MSLAYDVKRLKEGFGELLEHQEGARTLADLSKYADDPVGFIREVLCETLTEKQVEIAGAVLTDANVVVRGCHGSGKDWLAARLALWWVYARMGLAILTGPTERQVKEILMRREVRRAFRSNKLPGDLFEMALRLEDNEQTGILAFTASDADRFTGHHAPSVFIVITEGQGVESEIYEAAQKVLTGENSRLLVVGNANRPVGKFYEIHRSPSWTKIRISAFDHINVREGREIIPGAVTRRWVDSIEAEYGTDSSFWQSAVLAEFPDDADESLVQRAWLEASAERWKQRERPEPPTGWVPLHRLPVEAPAGLIFSADPARYGSDKTALAVRRGHRLEKIILWSKASTMETVRKLVEHMESRGARHPSAPEPEREREARRGPPARIVVDVVGLGGGVVDRLEELGWKVESFNGGGSPEGSEADRFFNARAEAYWTLRKLLEEGKVDLPEDPLLWEELQATRWSTNSKGHVQIEPKELMKSEIGRSPDRADAVSMAFWVDHRKTTWIDPSVFKPIKVKR